MNKFGSLGFRIYGIAALIVLTSLLLGLLVLRSSSRTQEAFNWVTHSQEVIISLDSVESRLSRAESRLRGYLMTRDPTYLEGFDVDLTEANNRAVKLTTLVADNPLQERWAGELLNIAGQKAQVMTRAAQRMRADPSRRIPDPTERLRGRTLMAAAAHRATAMREEERRLLALRTGAAQAEVDETRALLFFGFPLLALLIGGLAWLIRIRISRPLADLLDVVTRFGAGDRNARAAVAGSAEFNGLASAYNDMANRLMIVNDASEARQRSVQLLSEMAQRLQAIQNDGELTEVVDCFMPQVLPHLAGTLYLHNHSRNMLLRMSSWGSPEAASEMFAPADCWGLRRGQSHAVETQGADLICAHAAAPTFVERRCEPVLAGGEVLGLLYIEGQIGTEDRFRLGVLMESIALALVNDNLRSRLREQSIRDPLTKLFNRRYMEEALAIETARAERSGVPLSIVMCDVDHFKRFNDEHGHEAGDLMLSAVAGLLQSHFRHGDIVCRYGGEEFIVIAAGAPPSLVQLRVEALQLALRDMTVVHHGRELGPVTMSFGIDSWCAKQDRPVGGLLGSADRALFEAKRLGRDRVQMGSASASIEAEIATAA